MKTLLAKERKVQTIASFVTFILIVLMTFNDASAQAPAASPAGGNKGQDVEVLINTLNEVLEENRQLKENMGTNKSEMIRVAEENQTLRRELSSMKKAQQRFGEAGKARIQELTEKISELESSIADLNEKNEKLEEIRKYNEAKIPQLEEQTEQLNMLLDKAVLEAEREDYLKLIENAQSMAQRSFNELSVSKKAQIELRNEMASAHYKLGNLLFDMKDFENAIHSYEKALEADNNDPWVHHNLGIIYDYYLHDDKKAIYHYKHYLQLKPVTEQANEIRERVLEMELKKNMIPEEPLEKNFYGTYNKQPR